MTHNYKRYQLQNNQTESTCCKMFKKIISEPQMPQNLKHSDSNRKKQKRISVTLANTSVKMSESMVFPFFASEFMRESVSMSVKKNLKSECRTASDSVYKGQDLSSSCSLTSLELPQVYQGGKNLDYLYESEASSRN